MQNILLRTFLMSAVFLLIACKKEVTPGNPFTHVPVVQPTGEPIGLKKTVLIDAAGGRFSSDDNSIIVIIPAGAVAAPTEFSVQEIINTCSAGIGKSFRLLPHSVEFKKPVSVSFRYSADEGTFSNDMFLAIGYQDAKGIWRLAKNQQKNAADKSITVQTTHFSNWTLMEWLQLKPNTAILEPGQQLEMKVLSYIPLTEGLLSPLVPADGTEIGIGEGHLLNSSFIKGWTVSGAGSVTGNGSNGKYLAPESVAGVKHATVSVTIKDPQSQLLLLSNITIIGEGIMFRIGGGEWQQLPGFAMQGEDNYNLGGMEGDKYMAVDWPGGKGNFSWLHNPDEEKGERAIGFFYTDGEGRNYKSTYYENEMFKDSGGSFIVDEFGNAGKYVTGSFTISNSAYFYGSDDTKEAGRTTVEAVFRVKRIR